MKKVYLVMCYSELNGNYYGPDVERIFDSKRKAINYINESFGNVVIAYDCKTDIYSHKINEYSITKKYIEEREVK